MSNYSKLIIFILVLVLISVAIVFIDSSVDSINKSMPDISNDIVQADKEYNEAVDLTNERNFEAAMDKAISAENKYNKSLEELSKIRSNFSGDIDDVHKEYINTVCTELELKLKAVEKLKDAIECFEVNQNATGTSYASEANDYIYEASQYQNTSYLIVEENPDLFKSNFIFS